MAVVEEGKDVQLLRALCNNTFEKIAKGVSEERFLELFQGIPQLKSKSKLKKVYKSFHTTLTEDLSGHLNDMIEDEKLNEKFTKRAELLQSQKEFEGTVAWRPSGDPKRDLRSQDMKAYTEIISAMEEYLAEREPYIEDLCEKVRQDGIEASNLQTTIDKTLKKIAKEDAILDEFEETNSKFVKVLAPVPVTQETE